MSLNIYHHKSLLAQIVSCYKSFSHILAPHMLALYNSILEVKGPHSQFLHSFITVIPKPGKDTSIPDNYRPITFLNSDYKIFTKILTNRLTQLLPKLTDEAKFGFVPARHAGDNTRRTIDLIDLLNKFHHLTLILSLDAQKAFDRLSWPYRFATLSH